jgi:uncharacterized membrane protein YhaH (DUF805 family)
MEFYLNALKNKYMDFSGRARRQEYWMYALWNTILFLIVEIVASFLPQTAGTVLIVLYFLAVLSPSLAVLVRRLHDTNKSAWWLLIGLIPFAGAIVLIVFAILNGQPGTNQYGPNPKEVAGAMPPTTPAASV